MSEPNEPLADEGEDTHDADFEAAMAADSEADAPEAKSEPEPEIKAEAEGDKKPPLPPEEIEKRWRQTQASRNEERAKRQAAEERAGALEQRLADLESKVTPAQAADRPDPGEDPIGYLQWLETRLDAEEQNKAQEQQRDAQLRARSEAAQAVVTRVQEFEADFRELNTDYNEAAEHLYVAKKGEYLDSGYTDTEAHNMVMAEFLTRADRALKAGKDPAEIVYSLAKRAGFGAAKAEPDQGAAQAQAKLARIAEGQKASSALAAAGGRGGDELDASSIYELEGAAFDKAFDKFMAKAARSGH